jgi:acyl-coenzyme A thioesterase PaaI-like protein
VPLVHHELCFGCGRTNLFGLLIELEPTGPGAVAGRCFIKQDHQGPERGFMHPGLVATALTEAMALACGRGATAETVEVTLLEPAPVGVFLAIEGAAEGGRATASAHSAEVHVAHAAGTFRF